MKGKGGKEKLNFECGGNGVRDKPMPSAGKKPKGMGLNKLKHSNPVKK